MSYFILGVTISGGNFWVDNVYTDDRLADEHDKIVSTVAYFGGGSVTVYEICHDYDVSIRSFEKVDGNPEIFLDKEENY